MSIKKSKLRIVKWVDSYTYSESWESLNNLKNPKTVVCISVGFIMKENKNNIIIIPHISDIENKNTKGFGRGGIVIPKRSIKKIIKINF